MRLLLDTHALAWWLLDDPKLSNSAKLAIASPSNEVFVSAISGFEMATKNRLGKWPDIGGLVDAFEAAVLAEGFEIVDMNVDHAILAGCLQGAPRDPFDRLIAAQAITEGMTVVSGDPGLAALGAVMMW